MNGKCQNKSILILAVYKDLFEQRFCVGEKKPILIPLSRNLNGVQNMHAWFSFLLSVPLAWNRHVEFILVRFLQQVLQSVGYATKKKSEQAGCIASTQPNSNTGSIFQLIVGFKERSFTSARVPFTTFCSNLSSGLNCWVHSHTGFESVTSTKKVSCSIFVLLAHEPITFTTKVSFNTFTLLVYEPVTSTNQIN